MTADKKYHKDTDDYYYDPGKRILARLIQAAGVAKQDDLADIVGVSQPTISRRLKRKQVPKAWVKQVVEKTHTTESWLLADRQEHTVAPKGRSLDELSPADWKRVVEPAIKEAIGDDYNIAVRVSDWSDQSANIHIEIKRARYAVQEPPGQLRAAEEDGPYGRGGTGRTMVHRVPLSDADPDDEPGQGE